MSRREEGENRRREGNEQGMNEREEGGCKRKRTKKKVMC